MTDREDYWRELVEIEREYAEAIKPMYKEACVAAAEGFKLAIQPAENRRMRRLVALRKKYPNRGQPSVDRESKRSQELPS